ncbi:MAG TPA: hypothetical protein VD908_08390 [Cytophagales bacterium]|nr:hypothetical protein [Cytophagales bacterium]
MKSKILPIISILIILSSCVSRKIINYERFTEKPLAIDYKVGFINIQDLRKNISSQPLHLPFISSPGLRWKNVPPVEGYREMINETIKRNFTGTDTPINLTIYLEDGFKEFSASFWNETEFTFVKIQIEAKDGNNNVLACSSQEGFTVKSPDAKYKRFEKQYQATLKNAIYNCLKRLK